MGRRTRCAKAKDILQTTHPTEVALHAPQAGNLPLAAGSHAIAANKAPGVRAYLIPECISAHQAGKQGERIVSSNSLKRLGTLGQSIWLDYIRRDLIASGGLRRLIEEDGLRGMTSNPSIFEKAIWIATITTRIFGPWRLKGKGPRRSMRR